jgi:hypothetical protein
VELLFRSIAQTSVTEAYLFCQGQPEATRRQMFETLVGITLDRSRSETTAARALELVNLPFNAEEEEWFEYHLTTGAGRSLKGAKDTVMMRRIATGNFSDALSDGELGGKNIAGLSWDMMRAALTEGLGPRAEVRNSTY